MVVKNHTHRFKRSTKDKQVFYCSLPDCFLKIGKELLVGKNCMCECGNSFALTHDLLRRAAPKCADCRTDISARTQQAAKRLNLSDLFADPDTAQDNIG